MLEIIAVILLCSKNSANAKARGKSGGAAIAYTLGLWFGCEILGAMFGVMMSGGDTTGPAYIVALLFAAGGGVGSYFIAKSGNVIEQAPAQFYPQQTPPFNASYPNQQFQPQNPPVQPVNTNPQEPMNPIVTQTQPGTATVTFLAKKVPGQFLVSSTTVILNGTMYQAEFNQPINILAPEGNVQIDCYMNYMGKSGIAQIFVALEPNKTYQLEYKSPVVMTSSGDLTIIATS